MAQQPSLDDLNSQKMALFQQGKYAEATPIAAEAVRVAESTFGPDDAQVAVALNDLALLYRAQGKYATAEPLYQRALSIDEKALGPDHPNVARDLNILGELYRTQGKYDEAEPLYQRSIAILEKTDDPGVANPLNNLALLYKAQGKYAEAEPLYQRALSIAKKALGPDDPRVALALNNLAELYLAQGKYGDAEPLFQRSLAIKEKALGSEHPGVAAALTSLAAPYRDQGKYAEAEPLYQRALQIDEKALGPDNPGVALALNNLAELYSDQGKYAEAEPLYERALQIDEEALGPDDPGVALALNNLAGLYSDQGKYAEAEPLLEHSLAIREKTLGPDHPEVAAALNNLSTLEQLEGKNGEAEQHLQRALGIAEKSMKPDDPNFARGLVNLATLYQAQGKYADAVPLYQRALSIDEKALGPEDSTLAGALSDFGVLYFEEGNYGEAEPLFQRALRIDEKALGLDHPGLATILSGLAALYLAQGRYAEAEPLCQRALRIDEQALGPDHPSVARELDNIAGLYWAQAKYSEAEPLLQRSVAIREKSLGPDHPETALVLNNLATLYDDQGKYAEAEPFYQRAFDSLFHQFQYNFTYMTEKDRLAFLDTVASNFPGYFSFVHRYREQDPSLTGSMYDLLLWEKGFVAASIAGMRRQIEASGDTRAIELLNQLAAKRTQIADLLGVNPPDRDLWRKQIDQLRAEADDIEKALVARSSTFAENQKLDRATWQQVRDALAPGEAAVEFARFQYFDKKWTDTSYYVALVVTRETKEQPEYIVLGERKAIEGDAFTRFEDATQARGFTTEEDTELPGKQAYDLIWKPLESALSGIKRIYVSPDGVLNQIPLGIIPTPDGKLLMERYDLRLLSSTKDILRSAPRPSSNTALLVGNPAFDLSEEQQRAVLEKLVGPQVPANSNPPSIETAAVAPLPLPRSLLSRDATNSGSELPSLPGTGAEVSTIAGLMKSHGWKAQVYLEDNALKSVVEQASGPRVVHLATHGFFYADQQIKLSQPGVGQKDQPTVIEDPMLRSGLYFAGADRTLAGKPTPDGLDNGVLTAMEAGSLNLTGTELVVLSACNTGRGGVEDGEGVFGLHRALEEAGAHAVLMSLWSVPDRETQELMQHFYSRWLSGTEMHEALKEAQLEMRAQVMKEHSGQDLPYYWGAFVLVGR
jgi:tetratricopeptide (TPR) repeat protein